MIAWELQKRLGSVPINFVAVHSIRAMIRDGREVLENMSRIGDRLLCVAALVKAGIVHDRHGPWRRFGDAFAGDPGMNDIAVDVEIARQSRR